MSALHQLVHEYESAYAQPWQLEMSELMREKMLGEIVGFEIMLNTIEGKFKLSQNRSVEDRMRVMQQLALKKNVESNRVAEKMAKYSGEK